MSRIILFDVDSANNASRTFQLPESGQYTIVAVGMQPGDFITFEVIHVNPGARAIICGCYLTPETMASLIGIQELLCPTCESDGAPRPVQLTERNPILVLDWPQDTLLRAIYHGDGVDMGTVTVWAVETNTPDLTDAMRGCPPLCCEDEEETWTETGQRRCDNETETVEVQEVSNCGNTRWVEDPTPPDPYWNPTGVYDCVNFVCQQQQVNPCGELQWVSTGQPCGESRHTITSVVCQGAVVEGGNVCWQVNLNAPVQGIEPLTIYFTLSGDEQSIHHYPAPVLVIPVGSNSGIVCVETMDDAVVENPRSLCIQAIPSARVSSVPAPVCCTVTDNEDTTSTHTLVSLTCNGPVVEGQPLTWTATLNSPVSGSNIVLSTTLSGTEQTDHSYPAPTITILVGATSGQATINTVNDVAVDATRSLCLTLNAHPRVTNLPSAPVCCDVLDDDAPNSTHTVTSVNCLGAVVEGGIVQWQVNLDSAVTGNNLLVTTVLSGAEQVAHGYAAPSVTIPVGSSSGILSVTTIDDALVEGDLQLCVTVNTSARITAVPAASCCTVVDNDTEEPTTYEIDIDCPATATEGDLVTWTVNVSPMVADVPLSISFNLTGDETIGHSYVVSPNPLVVPVGGTGGNVSVQTDDDLINEPDRLLCLQAMADPPRIPLNSNLCCVTILDDDSSESVHTVTNVVCDGPVEEGETLCWTVTLDSNVAGAPLTVNSTLSGSEQAVHGYAAPSVVIPIGSNSGQLCVNTTDDAIIESTLQLCLQVNTSSRISAVPAAVCCNVTDNDAEFGQAFGSMGLTCCNEDGAPGGPMPIYTVTFNPDGTIDEADGCTLNVTHDPGWADGSFDPNDYDVRITMTAGDPAGAPPNLGVWLNLGSVQSFPFGGQACPVTCTDIYAYHIEIAPTTDHLNPVAEGDVGNIELRRNNECL